jgi:DNA mismatch endonuclease (patch repair protein)
VLPIGSVEAVANLPASPPPTSPGRSRNMAAIRRRDTRIERAVRSLLHRRGRRFRVDFPIRTGTGRPIRPDVVFTRARVCVFIDGCFWHGCPEHGQRPAVRNGHYWEPKIAGNAERDRRQTKALGAEGWTVLRFWEHDDPTDIADLVDAALSKRNS